MALFTVELSDEDRAELERRRIELGCRSHAETVRRLIHGPKERRVYAGSNLVRGVAAVYDECGPDQSPLKIHVPVKPSKPFNPQPKKGKK